MNTPAANTIEERVTNWLAGIDSEDGTDLVTWIIDYIDDTAKSLEEQTHDNWDVYGFAEFVRVNLENVELDEVTSIEEAFQLSTDEGEWFRAQAWEFFFMSDDAPSVARERHVNEGGARSLFEGEL